MPKYTETYTLVAEDMASQQLASFSASVGKYFTVVSGRPTGQN